MNLKVFESVRDKKSLSKLLSITDNPLHQLQSTREPAELLLHRTY